MLEGKEVLQGGRGHDALALGCTKYMPLGHVGGVGNRSSWMKRVERRGFLGQVVLPRNNVYFEQSAKH